MAAQLPAWSLTRRAALASLVQAHIKPASQPAKVDSLASPRSRAFDDSIIKPQLKIRGRQSTTATRGGRAYQEVGVEVQRTRRARARPAAESRPFGSQASSQSQLFGPHLARVGYARLPVRRVVRQGKHARARIHVRVGRVCRPAAGGAFRY